VSALAFGVSLLEGSCWNPLNPHLRAWSVLNMVRVDGGTLTLGSDTSGYANEAPAHSVRLSTFLMSPYEITQGLYEQIVGFNPSSSTGDPSLPVESVSWLDAVKFCNALSIHQGFSPCYNIDESGMTVSLDVSRNGYRLPTEAEWEYAARGGQSTSGYQYSGSNTRDDVAWSSLNSDDTSHPVGELQPNELDLYDMSGNVSEWCWDGYDSESSSTNFYAYYAGDYYSYLAYYEPVLNPLGPNDNYMWYDTANADQWYCAYPVNRGGDFHYATDYTRVTSRWGGYAADYSDSYTGFRVVRRP
jgi:formylglycine-generating enzyme required for sulfatase activity